MIFHQLFDGTSSTYTYLLGDPAARLAALIDPVRDHVALYLSLLKEAKLTLAWLLETHLHADHVTAAAALRAATGARLALARAAQVPCADMQLRDGDHVRLGDETIAAIATPGHTPGCMSYLWRDRLFTGDALLIGDCGRTDVDGDAGQLYDSVTRRLFTLPADTLVYPAHDYHRRHVSNIAQERGSNPRLAGKSRDEFVALMAKLKTPRHRLRERTLATNQRCGLEDAAAH